jgi:hypothetical protein
MREKQGWEPTSIRRQIEFADTVVHISALTVTVFLRRDIGYRALNPIHLIFINGGLAVIAMLADPDYPDERFGDLLIFAGVAFFFGIWQRARRWRELSLSIVQHSYYIGTSFFEFGWLPNFCRRDRRIARFVDPMFCLLVGIFLLPYSSALGVWLMFAGMAVSCLENSVRKRELLMNLDMVDGLIESHAQGQTVEELRSGPTGQRQQPTPGVPTGVGSDIGNRSNAARSNRTHY